MLGVVEGYVYIAGTLRRYTVCPSPESCLLSAAYCAPHHGWISLPVVHDQVMHACAHVWLICCIYCPTNAISFPFNSALFTPVLAQSLDLLVTMQVLDIPCEARWPPVYCLCNPASSACPAHRSASGAPVCKPDISRTCMGNGQHARQMQLHANGSARCYQDNNCEVQGGLVKNVKLAGPDNLCLTSPLSVSSSLQASSTALPSFVLELRESKAPPGTCPVLKARQVETNKLSTGDSSFSCTSQKASPSSLPHL